MHEVELGVIFNGLGPEHPWMDRIGAYVLLLDMGQWSELGKAIKTGTPWNKAKVQDGFLILGDLIPKEAIEDPHNMLLELTINGETKQADNTGNMNFKIDEQVAYMEQNGPIYFNEGDLLMSGTPEGIAPVREGDHLHATLRSPDGSLVYEIRQIIGRETEPHWTSF